MSSSDLSFIAFALIQSGWPLLLVAALSFGILAIFVHGRNRAAIAVFAALLSLPGLGVGIDTLVEVLGKWRERVEYARTHTRLAEATVVDGIALPAGAVVQWADASHTRIEGVEMTPAAEVFGVRARYLLRFGENRWSALLEDAATLDGWACAASHASFTTAGRLLSCTLARTTDWKGWVLPEGTEIDPEPDGRRLSATVWEAGLDAPGVGRLPYNVVFHDDGSVAEARYHREAPLRVGGSLLWDDVRWNYGAEARGQGRARVPVSVSGLPVEFADAFREEGRRVVVPLPTR